MEFLFVLYEVTENSFLMIEMHKIYSTQVTDNNTNIFRNRYIIVYSFRSQDMRIMVYLL